jgi:hypothetical protein
MGDELLTLADSTGVASAERRKEIKEKQERKSASKMLVDVRCDRVDSACLTDGLCFHLAKMERARLTTKRRRAPSSLSFSYFSLSTRLDTLKRFERPRRTFSDRY